MSNDIPRQPTQKKVQLQLQNKFKGAGTFHSAGQSKEGNLVLALPSIRFSWNFYQIICGTKYV